MRKFLSPSIVVPTVLTLGLIAALLAFADVKAIIRLITRFPIGNALWFFAIMVVYEVVRCAQWTYLLWVLRIDAPLRSQIYAFTLNEFSRNLPVGSYFQNYLLQQSTGADFGRTSAATTLILVSEVGLCVFGVFVLGLGSWTVGMRIAVLAVALVLLAIWACERLFRWEYLFRWTGKHEIVRKAMDEVQRFREGTSALIRPHVLIIQGVLGVAYLALAGAGLYVVVQGLDPHNTAIGLTQALIVYLFTLATAAIFPIPEAGGVGGFLAFGVSRNVAVGAMLLNRALSVVFSLVSVVVVTVLLPGELRAILQARQAVPGDTGTAATP